MIDLMNFVHDKDDLLFLRNIKEATGIDSLSEVRLIYKGNKHFSIEPLNGKIVVFGFGERMIYETIEELFFNFMLDGKPFIEQLSEIEFE